MFEEIIQAAMGAQPLYAPAKGHLLVLGAAYGLQKTVPQQHKGTVLHWCNRALECNVLVWVCACAFVVCQRLLDGWGDMNT